MTLKKQIKQLEEIANLEKDSYSRLAKQALAIIKKQEELLNIAIIGLQINNLQDRENTVKLINDKLETND